MWSRKYEKCIKCGTNIERHLSKGLCIRCYHKENENKHKRHTRGLRIASQMLSEQYIVDHYHTNNESLSDIAKNCGCSRQFVFKKIKEYGIPLRSKSSSRCLALNKNKLSFNKIDDFGNINIIHLQKININEHFFENWTEEMAWVLGVIFTDGCIGMIKNYSKSKSVLRPIMSVAQKETEILIKILSLMNCNAKIRSNKLKYPVYLFQIDCTKFYDDLKKYGLHPKKSLDIHFPVIPQEYVRHFIRGCWDGDGSVYKQKDRDTFFASYVSGSLSFINGILNELEKAGLPKRKVHIKKGISPSYYFRFSGNQCVKLFHYLYDDVSPTLYLQRKYDKFKAYYDLKNSFGKKEYNQTTMF